MVLTVHLRKLFLGKRRILKVSNTAEVRLLWQNKPAELSQNFLSKRNTAMTTGMAVDTSWKDQYSKIPNTLKKTTTNIIKQFLFDVLACLKDTIPSSCMCCIHCSQYSE